MTESMFRITTMLIWSSDPLAGLQSLIQYKCCVNSLLFRDTDMEEVSVFSTDRIWGVVFSSDAGCWSSVRECMGQGQTLSTSGLKFILDKKLRAQRSLVT